MSTNIDAQFEAVRGWLAGACGVPASQVTDDHVRAWARLAHDIRSHQTTEEQARLARHRAYSEGSVKPDRKPTRAEQVEADARKFGLIGRPHTSGDPLDDVAPGEHPLDREFGLGFDCALPCPVHRFDEHHELHRRRWALYMAGGCRGEEPRGAMLRCTCHDSPPCADPTHETRRSMRGPRPWCTICVREHVGVTEQ